MRTNHTRICGCHAELEWQFYQHQPGIIQNVAVVSLEVCPQHTGRENEIITEIIGSGDFPQVKQQLSSDRFLRGSMISWLQVLTPSTAAGFGGYGRQPIVCPGVPNFPPVAEYRVMSPDQFERLPAYVRGYLSFVFGDDPRQPYIPAESNPFTPPDDDHQQWDEGQLTAQNDRFGPA